MNKFSLTFLLFYIFGFSQAINSSWIKIFIKDLGSIELPKDLEIKNSKEQKFFDWQNNNQSYDSKDFLATFKDKKLKKIEASVRIETAITLVGDYHKLNTIFTQSQIDGLNEITKKQIKNSGIEILKWFPMKSMLFSNANCLTYGYHQKKNGAVEFVRQYLFYNNDRMHQLTFTYHLSQKEKWETVFKKVINSLIIENRR